MSRLIDPSNLVNGSSSIIFSEYQSTIDNILDQLDDSDLQVGPPRVDIPPADPLPLLKKQQEIESNNLMYR